MDVEVVELATDDKGEGGAGGARRRGKGKVQRQWKPPSDFIVGRRGRRAAGAVMAAHAQLPAASPSMPAQALRLRRRQSATTLMVMRATGASAVSD